MNWLDFSNTIKHGTSGVYLIKNKVNDKVYVGISSDLRFRIKKHFHKLNSNSHHNSHLQKSVNLYGLDQFSIEIIELTPECNLLIRENFFQQLYKATDPNFGYNESLTDVSGTIRHSEKSKQKIGIAHKGKKLSLETRLKISVTLTGREGTPHTEEYRSYMSSLMSGRKMSEEIKQKLSVARRGRPSPLRGRKLGPMPKEQIEKMTAKKLGSLNPRAVRILSSNGQEYSTIKEASEALGVCRSTIVKMLKNGILLRKV